MRVQRASSDPLHLIQGEMTELKRFWSDRLREVEEGALLFTPSSLG